MNECRPQTHKKQADCRRTAYGKTMEWFLSLHHLPQEPTLILWV